MSDEITVRQVRALLEAQTKLRRVAEEQAQAARKQLERVAEGLCPEAVDQLRRQGPVGLAGMSAEQVTNLVLTQVRRRLTRLGAAEVSGRSVADLLDSAEAEVERLRAEVLRLQVELERVQDRARQAETRAAVLERLAGEESPPAAPTTPGPAEPVPGPAREEGPFTPATPWEHLPAWIQKWAKSDTWKRDVTALRVLGDTGVARRTEAQELFGQATGLSPGVGSVWRAFDRLRKRALVEVIGAEMGARGQAQLLRLTRQGEDAYRLLWGRDPAPSQTTEFLNRHKSAEHTLLILAAADVLAAAGWRVDLFPERVQLQDGGVYEPDLVAVDPGENRAVYVEGERQTQKRAAERQGKWERCYRATGGDLCIAVPDQEALEAIRSEVLFWVGTRKFRLRMMVVGDARPDRLWAYVREQKWK